VSKLCDEASFAASSRQIELVARESEVETLSGELAELRSALEEAERRQRKMASEERRGLLLQEDQRAGESERKVERLTTSPPDGMQPVRPPEGPHGGAVGGGFSARQGEAETDVPPEASGAPSRSGGEDVDTAVSKLAAARDILQERLTAAGRESRGASDLSAAPAHSGAAGQDDTQLREQMADLAAEMIRLTAQLDGPDSPIVKALSGPAAAGGAGGAAVNVTSLADRVQALQRATAAAAE